MQIFEVKVSRRKAGAARTRAAAGFPIPVRSINSFESNPESLATGFTVKCDFETMPKPSVGNAFGLFRPGTRFPSISPFLLETPSSWKGMAPIPKLPLGIGISPAASKFAILSCSEPFVLLFAMLLGCVAVRGGSGEEGVVLGFGEVEDALFCWLSR